MRFNMPEMCTSSYVCPLKIFLSFSFSFWSPTPRLKCFASGGRRCNFLDMAKKRSFGELLLLLCSQLTAWKLPVPAVFRRLRGAPPDPNLTGFRRFCTPKSNVLTDKRNVNCSLRLFCMVSPGRARGSWI